MTVITLTCEACKQFNPLYVEIKNLKSCFPVTCFFRSYISSSLGKLDEAHLNSYNVLSRFLFISETGSIFQELILTE